MRRLTSFRHARELGFEIDAIRTRCCPFRTNPTQPCARADEIARARLVEVERRIASLMDLKGELERMIR